MTIKPVTSLADLEFKAKTDPYYRQLAILGCKSLIWNCNIKTYPNAIKKIHEISIGNNPESCDETICYINVYRDKIKPEKDILTELLKKKEIKKIVDKLKKRRGVVTRKTVRKVHGRVNRL